MNTTQERATTSPDSKAINATVKGILIILFIAVVAAVATYWSVTSLMTDSQFVKRLSEAKGTLTAVDLVAIPLLIIVVLGFHEVGHLIGGMSQGMRFLLLIVGPFGWHSSVSGIRFEWNTNVALMGGLAATLPTRIGNSLRRQLLVNIAAGPIASLILSIFAFMIIPTIDTTFAPHCLFVAATSFGIFLVTLIPMDNGGFMSDGMQIIDVLRGGNAVMERAALLQITAQSLNGVRPRDWDQSALDTLATMQSDDPLRNTGGALYLLATAMDSNHDADVTRYRTVLENGVEGFPSGFKQSVYIELAICAWLAADTDGVRRYLEAGKGGIVEKSRRLLAQAALAKLEGRDEDCERDRLMAIKALAKAGDAGQAMLTKDQLGML